MKQKLILLALVMGLTIVSQTSFSLGMGKIQVYSALDEPLQSSIELITNAEEELMNLDVKLASSEDYKKVGLDKSFVPANIMVSFDEENPHQINVTSNGPVTEPIVSLLLDVNWNNGRILREFTVLLDPPVYDTITSNVQMNQVAVEAVDEPITVDDSVVVDEPTTTVDVVSVEQNIEPIEEETPVYTNEDVAVYDEVVEQEPVYSSTSSEVLVEAGDTLWRIANDNKVGDLSAQQMMMAIYNNNTDAFIDNNINQLIKGSQLTIPTFEEAKNIGYSEALAQVESHHQSWSPAQEEYTSFQTQEITQEPANDTTTNLDYGVQLSGNDSDGSDSGQSNSDEGLATEVQAMEEDLYNKDSENTDLKERISELEDIVEQQQDAIEIKDDGLSNLENQLAQVDDEADAVIDTAVDSVDEVVTDVADAVDDIWDGAEGAVDATENALDESVDQADNALNLAVDVVDTEGTGDDSNTGDDSSDEMTENDADVVSTDNSNDVDDSVTTETVSPPRFSGTSEQSMVDTAINWVMDNLKWVLMGLVGLILLIFLPRALRSKDDTEDGNSFLDDIKNGPESEDDIDDLDSDEYDEVDTKMNQPLDLSDDDEDSNEDDVLAELDKSIVFDESTVEEVEDEIEDTIEDIEESVEDGFDVDGFLNDDEDNSQSVTADHAATLAGATLDADDSGEGEIEFDDLDLDFDDEIEEISTEIEDSVEEVIADVEDSVEDVVDEVAETIDNVEDEVDEAVAEVAETVDEDDFSFDDDFDFDLDEELEELEELEEIDELEIDEDSFDLDDQNDATDADDDSAEVDDFDEVVDISDEDAESFEIIEDKEVDMDEEIDLGLEDLLEDADAIDTKLDLAKAYIDMGDAEGAKNLLNEIFTEGSEEQISEAKKLLDDM